MNILSSSDTICAVATASGGAIGIIRVSGTQAIAITDKIFVPATGRDGKSGKNSLNAKHTRWRLEILLALTAR